MKKFLCSILCNDLCSFINNVLFTAQSCVKYQHIDQYLQIFISQDHDSVKCLTTHWQLIFKTCTNPSMYLDKDIYILARNCCFTFSVFYDLLRDDDPVSIPSLHKAPDEPRVTDTDLEIPYSEKFFSQLCWFFLHDLVWMRLQN